MKSVAQNNLRTHVDQRLRHHTLDGAVRAHRHEDRGLHDAVVQRQGAAPGVGGRVGGENLEGQHRSVFGSRYCKLLELTFRFTIWGHQAVKFA